MEFKDSKVTRSRPERPGKISRQEGFESALPVEHALERIAKAFRFRVLQAEEVPLEAALGRVLAAPIVSPIDIPPSPRSAVDGYAVISDDTRGAGVTSPRELVLAGVIPINYGEAVGFIRKGEAYQVATGGPIPSGADAVLMVEDSRRQGDLIEVLHALPAGANISPAGEDVKKDQLVLAASRVLQPPDLGMLAALGMKTTAVVKRPLVAVLAIGDELTDYTAPLAQGRTRETNRLMLRSYIHRYGAEFLDLGVVPDQKDQIAAKLKAGIAKADIVCSTGGTSVGTKDLSIEVAGELGNILFHGVALTPGMPVAVTQAGHVPLVSLSGFSVAVIVEFLMFVAPMIQKMLGVASWWFDPVQEAILVRPIPSRLGRLNFVRVKVYRFSNDPLTYAEPIRVKGSGILSSMIRSNGFILVPPNVEGVPEGDKVYVNMLAPIEARKGQEKEEL